MMIIASPFVIAACFIKHGQAVIEFCRDIADHLRREDERRAEGRRRAEEIEREQAIKEARD